MGRYATREEEIDRMLRGKLFVDLYQVVRQGIRARVESYSIKQMEPFYGFERSCPARGECRARDDPGQSRIGGASVITLRRRETVLGYNGDDCEAAAGYELA